MLFSQPERPELSGFARRNEELRQQIRRDNLPQLAHHTGGSANLEQNVLELFFWDRCVSITFPEIQIIDKKTHQVLPEFSQAMILYYLLTADGTPLSERWISFSELPHGRFYQHAFQGYTGRAIARQIGNHLEGFIRVAEKLIAQKASLGHAAYFFQALPRVSLLVVQWQGDEDFPANFQILFDESAPHYLPSDGYAILGSQLSKKIISCYREFYGP